jgi:hypothetical protein
MLQHCWHDVNVKIPGGRLETVDTPTLDGRVCCYCGETRTEPLPPMRPKRAHGPFVDDDSEWYVDDMAQCPGLALVELNPEPAVVRIPVGLSSRGNAQRAWTEQPTGRGSRRSRRASAHNGGAERSSQVGL